MAFHKWVSTDSAECSQCLTCGGVWLTGDSEHTSFRGEIASNCSGNTQQCHHYFGECPEETCGLDFECNCLHCDS